MLISSLVSKSPRRPINHFHSQSICYMSSSLSIEGPKTRKKTFVDHIPLRSAWLFSACFPLLKTKSLNKPKLLTFFPPTAWRTEQESFRSQTGLSAQRSYSPKDGLFGKRRTLWQKLFWRRLSSRYPAKWETCSFGRLRAAGRWYMPVGV